MLIKIETRVTLADALGAIPDDALRAEIEARANGAKPGAEAKDVSLRVAGRADQRELMAAFNNDAIRSEVRRRNIADSFVTGVPRDQPTRYMTDMAKDISRAVKDGDGMHLNILLNRLAPNAGII